MVGMALPLLLGAVCKSRQVDSARGVFAVHLDKGDEHRGRGRADVSSVSQNETRRMRRSIRSPRFRDRSKRTTDTHSLG
jgi:hypothetical protein